MTDLEKVIANQISNNSVPIKLIIPKSIKMKKAGVEEVELVYELVGYRQWNDNNCKCKNLKRSKNNERNGR